MTKAAQAWAKLDKTEKNSFSKKLYNGRAKNKGKNSLSSPKDEKAVVAKEHDDRIDDDVQLEVEDSGETKEEDAEMFEEEEKMEEEPEKESGAEEDMDGQEDSDEEIMDD